MTGSLYSDLGHSAVIDLTGDTSDEPSVEVIQSHAPRKSSKISRNSQSSLSYVKDDLKSFSPKEEDADAQFARKAPQLYRLSNLGNFRNLKRPRDASSPVSLQTPSKKPTIRYAPSRSINSQSIHPLLGFTQTTDSCVHGSPKPKSSDAKNLLGKSADGASLDVYMQSTSSVKRPTGCTSVINNDAKRRISAPVQSTQSVHDETNSFSTASSLFDKKNVTPICRVTTPILNSHHTLSCNPKNSVKSTSLQINPVASDTAPVILIGGHQKSANADSSPTARAIKPNPSTSAANIRVSSAGAKTIHSDRQQSSRMIPAVPKGNKRSSLDAWALASRVPISGLRGLYVKPKNSPRAPSASKSGRATSVSKVKSIERIPTGPRKLTPKISSSSSAQLSHPLDVPIISKSYASAPTIPVGGLTTLPAIQEEPLKNAAPPTSKRIECVSSDALALAPSVSLSPGAQLKHELSSAASSKPCALASEISSGGLTSSDINQQTSLKDTIIEASQSIDQCSNDPPALASKSSSPSTIVGNKSVASVPSKTPAFVSSPARLNGSFGPTDLSWMSKILSPLPNDELSQDGKRVMSALSRARRRMQTENKALNSKPQSKPSPPLSTNKRPQINNSNVLLAKLSSNHTSSEPPSRSLRPLVPLVQYQTEIPSLPPEELTGFGNNEALMDTSHILRPIPSVILHKRTKSVLDSSERTSISRVANRSPSSLVEELKTPNFDESCLPPVEKGTRWTPAEKVLMIHMYEIRQAASTVDFDVKLGRTWPKSSSVCYAQWYTTLRQSRHRSRLNLKASLGALSQILTLDMDIHRTLLALETFMHKGILPDGLTLPDSLPEPNVYNIVPEKEEDSLIDSIEDGLNFIQPIIESSEPIQPPMIGEPNKLRKTLARRQVGSRTSNKPDLSSVAAEKYHVPSATISKCSTKKSVSKRGVTFPYLSLSERSQIKNAMAYLDLDYRANSLHLKGTMIHMPFSQAELQSVLEIFKIYATNSLSLIPTLELSKLLQTCVKKIGINCMILSHIARRASSKIPRTRKSIMSLFEDLAAQHFASSTESAIKLRLQTKPSGTLAARMTTSLATATISRSISANLSNIRDLVLSSMKVSSTYNDMAGDVGIVAFSPTNDSIFAAGCFCPTDTHSMQYNNSKNLVIGDLNHKFIHELAYHYTDRPIPKEGKNSLIQMYRTQDPRLFESIPMVEFSQDGGHLISCGYDNKVRCFGPSTEGRISHINQNSSVHLRAEIDFGCRIDLVRVSKSNGQIAIGPQRNEVSTWRIDDRGRFKKQHVFVAENAVKGVQPATISWGLFRPDSHLLLAGFMESTYDDDSLYGQVALWNTETTQLIGLRPKAGMVFDASWSPANRRFACVFKSQGPVVTSKGAGTVVRIYHPNSVSGDASPWTTVCQLDCPAKDINDVVFCPYEDNYIAVGSTSSQVFVYDIRRQNSILHTFEHGPPLAQDGWGFKDTGIRFCSWNHSRHGLVTGSSDGVVKEWDIFRATDDSDKELVSLNSGVMAGAYSADFSKLIVGEVNRSVTILESSGDCKLSDADEFTVIEAEEPSMMRSEASPLNSTTKTGVTVPKPAEVSKCNIKLCKEMEQTQGNGDFDDSGRHRGRIPANLSSTEDFKARKGLRCVHCGAPSRPSSESDLKHALFPLCERCGFSCLRCGEPRKLRNTERIKCTCGEWIVGALGYDMPGGRILDANAVYAGRQASNANANLLENDDAMPDEFGYDDYYFSKFNLKQWHREDDCFIDLVTGEKYERSGVKREI